MKKIIRYFAILSILSILPLYAATTKISNEEVNIEIKKCMILKTSACFKDLWQKTNINIIRYNYALMLYNEKQYDKAKMEFRAFISDSKTEDQYVINAKNMIKAIDERKKEVIKSNAQDQGDYIDEMKTIAQWENPLNIKVYIQPSNGKERLFKAAFQTWDTRLVPIHFVFVPTDKNADIICGFVDYINKQAAGITKFEKFKIDYAKHKRYFMAPVFVDIALKTPTGGRPYTDAELQSIILHEIGHAIGIIDHSSNKNDIMFYSTETYKNSQISNRDVNTIKRIYK